MRGEVPKVLIEHFDPQKVEFRGVGFVGRHEVSVYADGQNRFCGYIEHPEVLDVLKTRVDGHVEVVSVLNVDLLELLIELFVFFAFGYDVGLGVGRVFENLLKKSHPRLCIINNYKPSGIWPNSQTAIEDSRLQQIHIPTISIIQLLPIFSMRF